MEDVLLAQTDVLVAMLKDALSAKRELLFLMENVSLFVLEEPSWMLLNAKIATSIV
jgi:hypothetical protein